MKQAQTRLLDPVLWHNDTGERDRIAGELERVSQERDQARKLAESRGQALAEARNRVQTLAEQQDGVRRSRDDEVAGLRSRIEALEARGDA